jgi:hypothetical protein
MSSLSFCRYQKDDLALPGNLPTIKCSSPAPPEIKCLTLLPRNFLFASTLLRSFLSLSLGFKGLIVYYVYLYIHDVCRARKRSHENKLQWSLDLMDVNGDWPCDTTFKEFRSIGSFVYPTFTVAELEDECVQQCMLLQDLVLFLRGFTVREGPWPPHIQVVSWAI